LVAKETTLFLLDGTTVTIDSTSKVSKSVPAQQQPPPYTAVLSNTVNEEDLASSSAEDIGSEGLAGLQQLTT
jgi:hypothetical protein